MEENDLKKLQVLHELEEKIWNIEQRLDEEEMASLLALNYTEISRTGEILNRQQTLSRMGLKLEHTSELENLKITQLDINTALVTYSNEIKTAEPSLKKSFRSSIWSRIDDNWKIRFHQATPFK